MSQDLNIGIALWLAAGGDGWVYGENSKYSDENRQGVKYKSKARIVLVGSGADEQCAGYGRHRTKYRSGRYANGCSLVECCIFWGYLFWWSNVLPVGFGCMRK